MPSTDKTHYPLVSILVVAKNEAPRLPRLLRLIERQSYPRIEVVLVDNMSSDETPEIMKNYQRRSRHRVKFVRAAGTLAKVYNVGLRLASGDYIAIVGADELIATNWVERLLECSIRLGCDACLGPVVFIPRCEKGGTKCSHWVIKWYYARSVLEILFNTEAVQKRIIFNTGNILFRASVLKRLQFFDPLPLSEDGELSYRFVKHGYRLCFTPKALAFHPSPQNLRQHISYWWKLAYANKALLDVHRYNDLVEVLVRNILLAHLDPREWVKTAKYSAKGLVASIVGHVSAFLVFSSTLLKLYMLGERVFYTYIQREK